MDCAGGERVLWAAVDAIKDKVPEIAIYSENNTHDQAREKIFKHFNLEIPSNLQFINVGPAAFLQPNRFPRFTLVLQAITSMFYALKCLFHFVPSVVLDSTGAPFAAIIWKLIGGCTVIFYTHYPYISTDMLHAVEERKESYNNTGSVAKSSFLSNVKIYYYRLMCKIYSLTGQFVDLVTVNSSWTSGHITQIYGYKPIILYPPCDCTQFCEFPLDNREKGLIISVGQFRPEKDYPLQLKIMEQLKDTNAHLVIIGGCRNENDQKLVNSLQKTIDEKQLNVELKTNLPYNDLKDYLSRADIGLHTMYNEHFGICAVEYISSGCIPMCNKSAGPLMDIVKDENYLALTCDEYVEKIRKALNADISVRQRFREESKKFSLELFEEAFIDATLKLIKEHI
ncbi:glycosyl transferase [Tritrichomonas foetus]|uniref:GDP-Man:Man(3)GlcNAc(2)-PP-Dol alpha-1,2-mannosyltransferase n=1 Tax=Tritrichomonas foetus TaxID=1144522 RepID=A0A1J4KD47_9EUKA|nr:glycosyl transferase [Tritrichomonas foetus]|eukprot:OHT08890.1 glycosyl transferase [Tritrichomonas foetus]